MREAHLSGDVGVLHRRFIAVVGTSIPCSLLEDMEQYLAMLTELGPLMEGVADWCGGRDLSEYVAAGHLPQDWQGLLAEELEELREVRDFMQEHPGLLEDLVADKVSEEDLADDMELMASLLAGRPGEQMEDVVADRCGQGVGLEPGSSLWQLLGESTLDSASDEWLQWSDPWDVRAGKLKVEVMLEDGSLLRSLESLERQYESRGTPTSNCTTSGSPDVVDVVEEVPPVSRLMQQAKGEDDVVEEDSSKAVGGGGVDAEQRVDTVVMVCDGHSAVGEEESAAHLVPVDGRLAALLSGEDADDDGGTDRPGGQLVGSQQYGSGGLRPPMTMLEFATDACIRTSRDASSLGLRQRLRFQASDAGIAPLVPTLKVRHQRMRVWDAQYHNANVLTGSAN